MENISIAIKALFGKVEGDEILKKAGYLPFDKQEKDNDEDIIRIDSKIQESMVVNRLLKVDRDRSIAYVGRNSVSSIGQNQSLTSLLN